MSLKFYMNIVYKFNSIKFFWWLFRDIIYIEKKDTYVKRYTCHMINFICRLWEISKPDFFLHRLIKIWSNDIFLHTIYNLIIIFNIDWMTILMIFQLIIVKYLIKTWLKNLLSIYYQLYYLFVFLELCIKMIFST